MLCDVSDENELLAPGFVKQVALAVLHLYHVLDGNSRRYTELTKVCDLQAFS